MRSAVRVILLQCLLTAVRASISASNVVELSDDNFDSVTASGIWMIKVYAPWCTHCRQLEPLWNAFADEAKADGVGVAKIDGTKEKALMNRFKVTAFPSVYLLRDGKTYTYNGARNIQSFRAFATQAYQSEQSWPVYKAPNSVLGRALGKIHSIPSTSKHVYRILRHDKGLSDTTIVLGFLSVPVLVGAVMICLIDALYVRRARQGLHEHED